MLSLEQFSNGQEGINNFLELASLDASSLGEEEGKSQDGVTLITMHNTKGLEFEHVYIVGMENEIFPSRLDECTNEDIEEERRICYVAMTRAKKDLSLFCASSRLKWGSMVPETPSMFLKEINEDHIDEIDLRLKSRFGGQFRFDNRGQGDYRSGYGNGFGNSYTSHGYTARPTSIGQSDATKYNIRNMTQKPILVKKADASGSTPVPGTVKYEVGDRIRSEFYGTGTITNKRTFGGREMLDVKFDTGRTGTFASDKVAFEKL